MDNNNRRVDRMAGIVRGVLEEAGLRDEDCVKAALGVARAFAVDMQPESATDLWALTFAKLTQGSPLGRPDLGELVAKEEFASLVGLKPFEVDKLCECGRLVGFEGERGRVYPAFQAWRGRLLPGVCEINEATAKEELSDTTRALFYLWPLFQGATVLEALRKGLRKEAIAFAKGFRGFLI